jgi:hypothetical protein
MKTAFRAIPVLQGGGRYHVPTAQGAMSKAVAKAERWVLGNRLNGEIWVITVEAYFYA